MWNGFPARFRCLPTFLLFPSSFPSRGRLFLPPPNLLPLHALLEQLHPPPPLHFPGPIQPTGDKVVGPLTLPAAVARSPLDEVRLHAAQTAVGERRVLGVDSVGVTG